MEICNRDKCSGCFACMSVCPKQAIEKQIDLSGCPMPKVNEDLCINCGLCKKVCPVVSVKEFGAPKTCYAAWNKSDTDRSTCASGGIATGLGRAVIEQGGVVFGTSFREGENLVLNFWMADTMDGLEKFKTSKYVQADTANSYVKAKEQLDEGKKVLYVGTPCQIAGLQGFLGKDYENLITVDIICHGVPPITYLREYQNSVCKGKEAEKATFRGKDDFVLCFYGQKGKMLYRKDAYQDYYFRAFLESLAYRENCYTCPYAQENRISDFTIGDFWELDKSTLQVEYSGKVSVILVNTEKAERFLLECQDKFYLEPRPVEEAVKGNTQLREPATPHKDRDLFLQNYRVGGFDTAIQTTCLKREMRHDYFHEKTKFIRRAVRKVKRIVKR